MRELAQKVPENEVGAQRGVKYTSVRDVGILSARSGVRFGELNECRFAFSPRRRPAARRESLFAPAFKMNSKIYLVDGECSL